MKLPLEACFSLVLTILVESALTAQSTTPAWRSFHSSAVANGKLIIFGGINNTVSGKNPIQLPGTSDLYVWDLKTRNWFQPEQDRPPKTPQKLQVSISPITSDKIFTFMPYAENGEGPVAVLDTNSWSWSYVTSSGAVPLSRLAFTYTIANEEAYLFGGTQADPNGALNGANILSDLSDFDTSQQVWYSASPGPAIYFHAACYLASQNSILYFGGSAQDQAVNRLHLFNLSTRGWRLDVPYTGENGGSSVPSARIGHTANCLTDKMIVFGGTGGTGQDTINSPNDNDVWILEFVNGTYSWSRAPIKNRSKSPTARMGHTATLTDNQLYIYGGIGAEGDNSMYGLDLTSWNWTKFDANPSSTEPVPTSTPFQPNNPTDNNDTHNSNGKVVIIVAILSSFFGILAMGVITGIGIRSWKRKKQRITRAEHETERKPDLDLDSSPEETASYLPSSSVGPHSTNLNLNEINQYGYPSSYLWNNSSCEASPLGKESSLLSLYNDSPSKASSKLLLSPSGTVTSSIGLHGEHHTPTSPEISNSGLQRRSSIPNSGINDKSIHEPLSPLDRIARLTLEEQYLKEVALSRNGKGLHVVNSLDPIEQEEIVSNPQLIRALPQRRSPLGLNKTQESRDDYNLDVFATAHDHHLKVKDSLDELREALLAETTIQVPRLFIVMPGDKAEESWRTPSNWNQDTFVLYILCEHSNTHITSHPGFPIVNPHEFLKNAGSLIASISRYCSINSLPFHTPSISQKYLKGTSETSTNEYFAEIVKILQAFNEGHNLEDQETWWERDNEESQLKWLEKAKKQLPYARSPGLTQLKDYLPEYVVSRPLAGLHYTKISPEKSIDSQECTRWLCSYHCKKLGVSHTM